MADSGQNLPGTPPTTAAGEPPRGIRQGSIDSKGRLKLPSAIKEYLANFGENKVFITSLDGRILRIYPIATWRENEKVLENFNDDPFAAEDISFAAYETGADCEVDSEGRLLVPQELRKRMNLENQPVWLHCHRSRINVYTSQVYQEMAARSTLQRNEKLQMLEKGGLK
jgi:MraZ protein